MHPEFLVGILSYRLPKLRPLQVLSSGYPVRNGTEDLFLETIPRPESQTKLQDTLDLELQRHSATMIQITNPSLPSLDISLNHTPPSLHSYPYPPAKINITHRRHLSLEIPNYKTQPYSLSPSSPPSRIRARSTRSTGDLRKQTRRSKHAAKHPDMRIAQARALRSSRPQHDLSAVRLATETADPVSSPRQRAGLCG